MDDDIDIKFVPYEGYLVEAVDSIVNLAKRNGCGKTIIREKDWEVLEQIIKMWQIIYPQESDFFYKSMKKWWEHTKRLGVSKEKGGAMIQHKLEVPQKLYQMIEAIFPNQKWDKKFVNKFAKRFKIFAGNKI